MNKEIKKQAILILPNTGKELDGAEIQYVEGGSMRSLSGGWRTALTVTGAVAIGAGGIMMGTANNSDRGLGFKAQVGIGAGLAFAGGALLLALNYYQPYGSVAATGEPEGVAPDVPGLPYPENSSPGSYVLTGNSTGYSPNQIW
ncbi:MAG: hypothetical protein FWB72_00530 [Firmicutes bacterium]|nr:hypothetical protein [Bacillota bacterium]